MHAPHVNNNKTNPYFLVCELSKPRIALVISINAENYADKNTASLSRRHASVIQTITPTPIY